MIKARYAGRCYGDEKRYIFTKGIVLPVSPKDPPVLTRV